MRGRRAGLPARRSRRRRPCPASESSTSARRRAARRPSSPRSGAEVVAVEKHPGRARELEGNARRLGASNVEVAERRRARAAAGPRRLRPRARRRTLLRARRPQLPSGPALAGPSRSRSSNSTCSASRLERVRPGGTITFAVCTIHRAENEDVVDAAGPARRRPRCRVARVPPSATTRVSAHAAARARDAGFFVARLRAVGFEPVPWREWMRTVEIEPSLYAADFARLGDQVRHLLNAGARVFHFDVGDGHFVEPITIGPIVLAVDRPDDPRSRRRHRLPSHGRQPGAPLPADRGGRRRQRHLPRRGHPRSRGRDRPRTRRTTSGRRRLQSRDRRSKTLSPPRSAPTSCSA